MSADWDDEPVGYKAPPRWTQFQKGRSGNPRGRPKKAKSVKAVAPEGSSLLDDALREERDRLVKVSLAGGSREIRMYEAIVRKLAALAAHGDTHAVKLIMGHWSGLELRDAARKLAQEELDERIFKSVVALKAQQEKNWAAIEKTGESPAHPSPHPDDIILDHSAKRWRVRGPIDGEDVPYYEYCRAERDSMLVAAALALNTNKPSYPVFYVCYLFWDTRLPKRWQVRDPSDAELLVLALRSAKELRTLRDQYTARADQLRPKSFGQPDKETYRVVNSAMKPLLNHYGFRSLAQFERAYELQGDALVWPKAPKDRGAPAAISRPRS